MITSLDQRLEGAKPETGRRHNLVSLEQRSWDKALETGFWTRSMIQMEFLIMP